jgi:NitT/TauT family transport system ATP-binding protein
VELPRPRDPFHIHDTPGFTELYDALWADIRTEIEKARNDEAVEEGAAA